MFGYFKQIFENFRNHEEFKKYEKIEEKSEKIKGQHEKLETFEEKYFNQIGKIYLQVLTEDVRGNILHHTLQPKYTREDIISSAKYINYKELLYEKKERFNEENFNQKINNEKLYKLATEFCQKKYKDEDQIRCKKFINTILF